MTNTERNRRKRHRLRGEAIVASRGKCRRCDGATRLLCSYITVKNDDRAHRETVPAHKLCDWLKQHGYPKRFAPIATSAKRSKPPERSTGLRNDRDCSRDQLQHTSPPRVHRPGGEPDADRAGRS